jgi:flagellar biosynthetic protein FlhB
VSTDRTEQPTAKRRRDARKKGQMPRSRDLAIAIASVVTTMALARFGPSMIEQLGQRLVRGIATMGDRARTPLTPNDIGLLVRGDAWTLVLIVGPLLGLGAIVGIGGNVVQSGWNVAPEALHFNWNKLNPANGFARLKPSQSGVELLKSSLVVAALVTIAWTILHDLLSEGSMLALMSPADAAATAWSRLLRLLWQSGFVLLAVGGADHAVQRWRLTQSLKMTKQEVKDEFKNTEGNPEIKRRIKKAQLTMMRQRMLKAVPTATVVVTNPTHYAVALEYRRGSMPAPIVVAKGADHMAARIKAIAREHGVPLVENVPLAQGLYKSTEIGDTIPADLFGAVAEVLAYLVRIKQLML